MCQASAWGACSLVRVLACAAAVLSGLSPVAAQPSGWGLPPFRPADVLRNDGVAPIVGRDGYSPAGFLSHVASVPYESAVLIGMLGVRGADTWGWGRGATHL